MQSKECPVLSTLSHGLPQPTMIFVFKKKIKNKQINKKRQGGFLEVEWWGSSSPVTRGVKSQCSAFWRFHEGL